MKYRLPILLLFGFNLVPYLLFAQENEAPKVTIIAPSENVSLKSSSIVPYSIAVSDKEDGNSEYDEINMNEVVLSVTFIHDASKTKKYVEKEVAPRSELLSLISSSNCFTCHSAKDKLIGPSFKVIADKYSLLHKNKSYLSQKISNGSKGVWGGEIMPAKPNLEKEDIEQILDWIFKNSQDSNYTYYTGTEGAFKTIHRPKKEAYKASYVLHALYTDHGLNESGEKSKKGTNTIVIEVGH